MLALLQYLRVANSRNVQNSRHREGIELQSFRPEQKEETTSSSELNEMNSSDITILGFQEVLNNYWLEIDELILISFLSVRTHKIASKGRYWRSAIRATFPMHPFEVWCWWVIAVLSLFYFYFASCFLWVFAHFKYVSWVFVYRFLEIQHICLFCRSATASYTECHTSRVEVHRSAFENHSAHKV